MEYTEIIENLTEYVVINVNSDVGILSKIYKDYKDSNIQPDISEIKMAMIPICFDFISVFIFHGAYIMHS